MSAPTDPLAQRYAAPPAWQRPLLVALVGVVVLAFLGWLAWATWFQATPVVESDLTSWTVVDSHRVDAVLEVRVDDGVRAHCIVRATAVDHTTVGEVTFTPHDGRNEVTIRTERAATSVERLGCTAPGQPRPR